MKVLLIDIDSTIPNLALKKIEKYHLNKGDEVIWNNPILKYSCDKTYVSCIFDWNAPKCLEWLHWGAEVGGSGYDLYTNLPPEIDEIKPHINLGFTTRGCVRNCPFCIVPRKEGKIHTVGDIYDLWDGKSKEIKVLDNNILAMPEHFFKICEQLRKEKLKVDFNQGLDFRLLDDKICQELFHVRHSMEIRFAFDDISYKPRVIKALELLKENGLKNWQTRWYVYVGIEDTFNTVLERLNILRDYKQLAFVMRDRKVYDNPQFIALAAWAGEPGTFKKATFAQALSCDRFKTYVDKVDVIPEYREVKVENGLYKQNNLW